MSLRDHIPMLRNMDTVTKTDANFPSLEGRTFLAVDGFGSSLPEHKAYFLVANTLCQVFESAGVVRFKSLFENLTDSFAFDVQSFKVQDDCHIRNEKGFQKGIHIVSRGGVDLIRVSYSRDYDFLTFGLDLLGPLEKFESLPKFEWNGKAGSEGLYRLTPDLDWVCFDERTRQISPQAILQWQADFVAALREAFFG